MILHHPVLLKEAIEQLKPKENGVYIDATFGAGGYSKSILENKVKKLYAIDRDPYTAKFAKEISKNHPKNFIFINRNFSEIGKLLEENIIEKCDGIVFDLGVSSMQLDQGERGFSFNKEGILDMRMGETDETALNFVNSAPQEFLADIIYNYGGETHSRRIAKSIIEKRKNSPIETTTQLAEIVRQSIPERNDKKIDLATKTFQAIRIYVNDELFEIDQALKYSAKILKKDGILVVISFHSLEDKIVKDYLKNNSAPKTSKSKYRSNTENASEYFFEIINKKVIVPTQEEITLNPRSRSAKLRAAIRTSYNIGEENAEF